MSDNDLDAIEAFQWSLHLAATALDGIPYTAPEVFPQQLRDIVNRGSALVAEVRRLRAESATRMWHRPYWSSIPGGSLDDGKCLKCREHWPCQTMRNVVDRAFVERDALWEQMQKRADS